MEQSSVRKGETLEDTARSLNAMRPDALVIRHGKNGAPAEIAEIMDVPLGTVKTFIHRGRNELKRELEHLRT